MAYKIESVPAYTQRDNKYIDPNTNKNVASISCFPTSLAMCMDFCLYQAGLGKEAIGADVHTQTEDYLNMLLDDSITTQWMKENQGRLGSWIWKYSRRTIYAVEVYLFNRIMNSLGYKAQDRYDLKYETICNLLEQNQLPMIIGGNFKSVSNVGSHMNTLIGFNEIGLKEFIVNDPYGNALTGYSDHNGEGLRYPIKFYERKNKNIYCVVISKI